MDKTRDSTNSKIWPDSTCAITVRRKGQILLVVESLVLSTTDQNSLLIHLKISNNQIKVALDKTSRQEMSKRAKLIKYCFLKRISFELIGNNMRQMKSMRDSFIPLQRAIEIFSYLAYVIRRQKGQQIQAKTKKLH